MGYEHEIFLAEEIANQLIENGEVSRGFLGIVIQQITTELAKSFNVKQGHGIIVSQVKEELTFRVFQNY